MGRQSRKLSCTMSLFAGSVNRRRLLENHASLQRRFVMATALGPIGKVSRDQMHFWTFLGLQKIDKREEQRERKIDHSMRADGVSGGVTILALHFACRVHPSSPS